ncbi:MAG: transposase [Bacilli bacterium]
MKIITQISIFDYSKIEILGDLERCKLLIDNISDEKIVKKLIEIRGKGRNDYPIIALWNSILIMPLIECSTVEQLRRELSRNRDLRKLCGFRDAEYYYGKCKLVPPPKSYTNLFKNLKNIEPLLKECFNELRDFMYDNLKDFGKEVGEDGKIFLSKSKGPNKNGYIDDGRCDMDADFTIKENYYKDPKTGESKARKKTYFGYRYHLLADVNYELPVEYTVTKASVGERDELKKHIEMLNNEKVEKIETLSADKGYDGKTLITYLVNKGIKPIIDIRCQWRDGEKTKQYKDTDLLYTYDGKVSIIDENNENIPLKYLGYDKVKNTLRYQHKSNVYSIDINYDKRIFTQIARDSKKWKRIYNKRTALERINGRFDRDFNLENHKVRGLKKATVLIDIMMIGMMAMAKGHILNNHPENIRKLKSM